MEDCPVMDKAVRKRTVGARRSRDRHHRANESPDANLPEGEKLVNEVSAHSSAILQPNQLHNICFGSGSFSATQH